MSLPFCSSHESTDCATMFYLKRRCRPVRIVCASAFAILLVIGAGTRAESLLLAAQLSSKSCLLATSSTRSSRTEPRRSFSALNASSNNNDNDGSENDPTATEKVERKTWNPLRLAVLRVGLTEPAMTSPLNYGKYNGKFNCAYCGNLLFDSASKYDSGSGWPSFWASAAPESVTYKTEWDGREEVKCGKCL